MAREPKLRKINIPWGHERLTRLAQARVKSFGVRAQLIAAVEEFAELSHVLCREANWKTVRLVDVQEEIADCVIMLTQVANLHFRSDEELVETLDRKLDKLEAKIAAAQAAEKKTKTGGRGGRRTKKSTKRKEL